MQVGIPWQAFCTTRGRVPRRALAPNPTCINGAALNEDRAARSHGGLNQASPPSNSWGVADIPSRVSRPPPPLREGGKMKQLNKV